MADKYIPGVEVTLKPTILYWPAHLTALICVYFGVACPDKAGEVVWKYGYKIKYRKVQKQDINPYTKRGASR